MPNMGAGMVSGTVAAWLKSVGDHVSRGDVIAEIETDKTTVQMEALSDGTLVEIVRLVGDEVPVGDVIAYLESEA